jgi:hypothetical protein
VKITPARWRAKTALRLLGARRWLVVLVAVLLLVSTSAGAGTQGRDALDRRFEEAFVAWDSGDYIDGVEGFLEVLGDPGGDRFLERIALISGELYATEEIAPDGRNIRISPDGRFAAYETTADGATVTRLARVDGTGDPIDIDGSDLVFGPYGRYAFLAVAENSALLTARNELEAVDPGDAQAVRQAQQQVRQARLDSTYVEVVDLSGRHGPRSIRLDDVTEARLAFNSDGTELYVVGARGEATDGNLIYAVSMEDDTRDPRDLAGPEGFKDNPIAVAGGDHLLYTIPRASPIPRARGGGGERGGRGGRGGRGVGGGAAVGRFAVLDLASGTKRELEGNNPIVSANRSTVAFSTSGDGETVLSVLDLSGSAEPRRVFRTALPTGSYEISPSGDRLVVQVRLREDWELFLIDTRADEEPGSPTPAATEGEATRLTNEIQHDLAPRFLTDDIILAVIGEGRHRRSYLYDVNTLERTRLFHNNTLRTIAPEYEWQQSADGSKILIVSERDGDTVSPERAVYAVDLDRKISKTELIARLETSLAGEIMLRAHGLRMYAPIAAEVRQAVSEVSTSRLYKYQKDLFDFGSKNITQPGNAAAREYLYDTYASFGYETALQWFETQPRGNRPAIRTANVLAKLEGTENPELVYVVSSHFDSTGRGPGADDNTSGTVMLLETARILASRPLPYSVIFASFTGEESGLLGSREFVRQAVENGDKVVGALNNDMMGWANDHHIDNTIRYSNPGIRDLQHAAAFLFSDLITYDALYYKSTDAAAYYEAYGDIVGGIGSYPVLGNPHYHQPHDVLETMNHEQIRETTKTNIASIMLLASSPARINGLRVVARQAETVELAWEPSPENSVFEYVIRIGPDGGPYEEFVINGPRALLDEISDGTLISVKAVSDRGVRGWDWAHVTVGQ